MPRDQDADQDRSFDGEESIHSQLEAARFRLKPVGNGLVSDRRERGLTATYVEAAQLPALTAAEAGEKWRADLSETRAVPDDREVGVGGAVRIDLAVQKGAGTFRDAGHEHAGQGIRAVALISGLSPTGRHVAQI
jgi:hypothetical protein